MSHALMTNYAPLPVSFSFGCGATLTDTEGNTYLDALGGIAVCVLGHAHPDVQSAVADQASSLIHTSNLYRIPLQEELAEKLIGHSGMDNVFFANSGAEANEAAIKLARLYGHNKAITIPKIVVMTNSFHGRTMATLTATGNDKVKTGFTPLVEGFVHIDFNDVPALSDLLQTDSDIVAVMLEPIQGEGGIRIPDDGYLTAIRECCDVHDCLMIVDEVQTGMCRTGKWFAFQHEAIQPDIMTLAKALANGVPIGACLARGKAAKLFQPGSHGSTFGGNPLAARAALAVIDVMEKHRLDIRAQELGERMLTGFNTMLAQTDGVISIRGKGLMIGIELDRPCTELVNMALTEKLLINVTASNVIRLLPALIVTDEEADLIVSRLSQLIIEFLTTES